MPQRDALLLAVDSSELASLVAPIERSCIGLTSCSPVKGGMIQTTLSYDTGTRINFEGDGPSV
jgi:hypothetical protein